MSKILCAVLGIACAGLLFQASAAEIYPVKISGSNLHISKPGYVKGKVFFDFISQTAVLNFTADPKRHNWAYICVKMPAEAPGKGYRAVQFTYRTRLPEGVKLISVMDEFGHAYDCTKLSLSRDKWTTATLSLRKYRFSSWNRKKDENKRLDTDKIKTVLLGITGRVKKGTEQLDGTLELKSVTFLKKLPKPVK